MPRSGTTWIMELLESSISSSISINEPFVGIKPFLFFKNLHMPLRILKENFSPISTNYIQSILDKNFFRHNFFNDRKFTRTLNYIFARTMIIKFVRCNKSIPFLFESFPDASVIIINRSPLSVTKSMLNHGSWNLLNNIVERLQLYDLNPFKEITGVSPRAFLSLNPISQLFLTNLYEYKILEQTSVNPSFTYLKYQQIRNDPDLLLSSLPNSLQEIISKKKFTNNFSKKSFSTKINQDYTNEGLLQILEEDINKNDLISEKINLQTF